ncbi:radical SAM domain-containing [Micractinium conductrix]|uniref:Radical SAM domain-containing n=1 Tax=Micractinium conductrix TaxID=554055 RepID=A0A2P6V9M6_9CHLO|nr:radical SAM domain-containing [Micractinium conductrix]|eukprot:PSC70785.1 radical SAM domain-containing [Micractinium conductrix]
MVKKRNLSPQSVWDSVAVKNAFEAAGANTKHIPRMYNHLIRHPGSTWSDVPDLPKAAVAALDAGFALFTTRLLEVQRSSDGETTKLLVQLQDGLQVESVVMEYDNTDRYAPPAEQQQAEQRGGTPPTPAPSAEQQQQQQQQQDEQQQQQRRREQRRQQDGEEEDEEQFHDALSSLGDVFSLQGGRRATLCVSSEVGCAMGCTFCATGTMGLTADLTAGEIVEQLVHAGGVARIRNIVFMGMGEPLNNYEAVCSAVHMMTDPRVFGLRRKKVTVSTVGVVPRLLQMADDMPGVSLALSLHAPTQELRQTIVPSAKAFKLDKLMAAVDTYQQRSGRSVFVEYVMLGPDVNCTEAHAHQLGALLKGRDVLVNLIPWNPILSPTMTFAAPHDGATAAFHRVLRHEYGVNCTIRAEKGQDISGACGQLVLEHGGRLAGAAGSGGGGACGGKGGVADLEDLLAPAAVAAVR